MLYMYIINGTVYRYLYCENDCILAGLLIPIFFNQNLVMRIEKSNLTRDLILCMNNLICIRIVNNLQEKVILLICKFLFRLPNLYKYKFDIIHN